MEEIQKKTRKVSNTKNDDKTTKIDNAKKGAKTTKPTSAQKEAAPKKDNAKKKTVTAKTTGIKKEAIGAKSNKTQREATKTSKAEKEAIEPKTIKTKKEISENKISKAKKEVIETKKSKEPKEVAKTKTSKAKKEVVEIKTSKEPKEVTETKTKKDKKEPIEIKTTTEKQEVKIDNKLKPNKEEKKQAKNKKKANKSKEEKQENKNQKQPGKHVDISIGAIIAVIVIIALVLLNVKLGKQAYNIIKQDTTTNNENSNSGTQSSNSNEIQEIGQVLNTKNEIVTEVLKKMTFSTNATASIYKNGSFNTDTIPNDLKLRLGWSRVEEKNKLKSIQANGTSIIAVEKQVMKNSIQDIFGLKIKYEAKPFNNVEVTSFATYEEVQGMINYENDMYIGAVTENNEIGVAPLIYQEVQKVVQYSSGKVKVYVKTAFADVKDGKYILYKEYNDGFSGQLLEITPEEIFKEALPNQATGEGTIIANTNSSLNSIRGRLDTYTYTFEYNDSMEEYYLTEFNKEANND